MIKIVIPLALGLSLGSCVSQQKSKDGLNWGQGSVIASIPGVDDDLSSANDLKYILMCHSDAARKLSRTTDKVSEVLVTKDKAKAQAGEVAFAPLQGKTITDTDTCAIDVIADANLQEAEKYKFKGETGLLYATTKARLTNRVLEVSLYKLFTKTGEPQVEVSPVLLFSNAPAGEYTATLDCGSTVFTAQKFSVTANKNDYDSIVFGIPKSNLSQDASCTKVKAQNTAGDIYTGSFVRTVNATWDKADRPRISMKLDSKINAPAGGVKTEISEGTCPQFDASDRSCKPLPEGVQTLGKEASSAFNTDDLLFLCEADSASAKSFFGTQVRLVRTKDSAKKFVLLFKKNGTQAWELRLENTDVKSSAKTLSFKSTGTPQAEYIMSFNSLESAQIGVKWVEGGTENISAPKYWVSQSCSNVVAFANW